LRTGDRKKEKNLKLPEREEEGEEEKEEWKGVAAP